MYDSANMIREWRILKESPVAYHVREVPRRDSFADRDRPFEMWVPKDHSAIADVDGKEPVRVKQEGNVFIIQPRK